MRPVHKMFRPAAVAATLLAVSVTVCGCGPDSVSAVSTAATAVSSPTVSEPAVAPSTTSVPAPVAAEAASPAPVTSAAKKPVTKKPVTKPLAKKPAVKKPTTKPVAKKPAAKKAAPKPVAKKPAVKKPAPKKSAPKSVRKFSHATVGTCSGEGDRNNPWKVTWTAHYTDGSKQAMTGKIWGLPEQTVYFEGQSFLLHWKCPLG